MDPELGNELGHGAAAFVARNEVVDLIVGQPSLRLALAVVGWVVVGRGTFGRPITEGVRVAPTKGHHLVQIRISNCRSLQMERSFVAHLRHRIPTYAVSSYLPLALVSFMRSRIWFFV